jgi:AcrR family transcriptional regulator
MRERITPGRLAAAGADLADEVGFEQVTLTAIAAQFGVKVASLYSHVKSSHDLKVRIALLALEELADRGAAALAGRAGKDALVALANVQRDYARERPGRWAAAQLRLDAETAAASAGRRHTEMLHAILRGYDLPPRSQIHAIRFLASVFAGFVGLELSGAFDHRDPSTEESWERILDSLDATLRGWPSAEQREGSDD